MGNREVPHALEEDAGHCHPATEILRERATDAPASSSAWPTDFDRVVDPRLVGEDATGRRRVEALREHAVHDLLTRGLGLRLHLVRVQEDRRARPRRPRRGRRHAPPTRAPRRRCASRAGARAPPSRLELDEDADLVRGRMRVAGEDVPVRRLEALGAHDHDVLAELRDELEALLLEALDGARAFGVHRSQDLVARTAGTPRSWRRARSRSRCRRSSRRARRGCSRRGPRSSRGPARLPADAIPRSRRSVRAASTSPPVSSSARLQSIIPAPVRSRSSLTRDALIVALTPSHPPRRGRRLSSPAGSGSGSGSRRLRRPRPCLLGGLGRRSRRVISAGVTFVFPASMPSATTRVTRLQERIASSFPGITKSASSGSAFVSTRPTIGHAEAARLAHGELLLLQVDDEDRVRLALHVRDAAEVRLELLELRLHRDALLRRAGGRAGRRSSGGGGRGGSAMRSEIVRQFVSRPPSQRLETYGMPTRFACSETASCACFFVPTKSIVPPRSETLRAKSCASSSSSSVFVRSMM